MLKALKNLFRFGEKSRYKNRQVTNDLSLLVSDVHSHLVPGVDDGSPDMETSIALIRRLQDLGYTKLVTTPHIMADLYPNTPEIL
ncbi:MAG: CpsB/CapC family capsule biosynthesis tyrosine phosphatase, partial [Flavobacteriales bacterium]